jgi:hypothetical protein
MKRASHCTRMLPAGLLLAMASPAAAQTPTLRSPFDLLRQHPPRLEIHPGFSVLQCCALERRVDMQVRWPALEDASPATLLLDGGFLASGPRTYSRAGIGGRLAGTFGDLVLTADAGAGVGTGSGPRRQLTMVFGGAIPWLSVNIRSTWYSELPADTPGPGLTGSIAGAGPIVGTGSFLDGNHTDGELTASHRFAARVMLQATGGLRFGGDGGTASTPAQWLWSEMELPVRHGLSLLLAGGVQPRRPELAQPGGRFARFGLRFDLGAAPPAPVAAPPPESVAHYTVVALEPDRYMLRLHVPDARAVNMRGDVTDWEVVAMHRVADNRAEWETELLAPPGLYHISISVDGGPWIVPEGLAPVPDGFGGATGLLTLGEA